MKKYNFIIGFINAKTNQTMNDVAVEVRAFTYKGARTKALNLGQEMVRKCDESDVCAFMRVCKLWVMRPAFELGVSGGDAQNSLK